jgi:hypothetical protein
MSKHKKIAIVLHLVNALCLAGVYGILMIVMSHAFLACSTSGLAQNPRLCAHVLLTGFGAPFLIGLMPVVALLSFGKIARGFLWVYSILGAIPFFPVGTIAGIHTIYLLRLTADGGHEN